METISNFLNVQTFSGDILLLSMEIWKIIALRRNYIYIASN